MLFAVFFGIPLGFFAAKRYGGVFDHFSLVRLADRGLDPDLLPRDPPQVRLRGAARLAADRGPDHVLIDLPHPTNFYILDALIAGDLDAFWDVIKHLILPAIALGSIPLAIIARITRAAVLDVQNEDYVRTARAKGDVAAASSTAGTCSETRCCRS